MTGHLLRQQQIVDHDQATKHLADGHRLLPAIGDAGVGRPARVKSKKVIILRDQDTSGRCGERKLSLIGRSNEAGLRSGRHIDVAAAKTSRDVG